MGNVVGSYEATALLMVGLPILTFVLLILVAVLFWQLQKMKRRLNRFLGTGTDKHDMEVMLGGFLDRTEAVGNKYEQISRQIYDMDERLSRQIDDLDERLNRQIAELDDRLGYCLQRTGLVRYNPFHDTGGDLSFALVLLDDHKNGIAISSIYGRDSCYTYGKTITEGNPSHSLSPEEQQAMQKAVGQ